MYRNKHENGKDENLAASKSNDMLAKQSVHNIYNVAVKPKGTPHRSCVNFEII